MLGFFGYRRQRRQECVDAVGGAGVALHGYATFGFALRAVLHGHAADSSGFGGVGFADETGEASLEVAEGVGTDSHFLSACCA